MSCLLTSGSELKCRSSIGGVDTVYIANYEPDLRYSFHESDRIRSLVNSVAFTGALTYSSYSITYTSPLSGTQTTLPIRPAVGDVINVQWDNHNYAALNGTQTVTFVVRNPLGLTILATDRLIGTASPTFSLTSTFGSIEYQVLTNEITVLPDVPFYTLNQGNEVASFNQIDYTNTQNGTQYFEQITSIVLNGLPSNKEMVNTLNRGTWVLLIKDNNGNYWISGYNQGARTDSSVTTTGRASGDMVGTTLTFKSKGPISYKVRDTAALARIVQNIEPIGPTGPAIYDDVGLG